MTIFLSTALAAAAFCVVLILILKPLLMRYALARPNARSSHRVPTPQGGGMAVIAAMLIASAGALALTSAPAPAWGDLVWVAAGAILLALVGAVDDIRPLPALPRLALQVAAVAALVLIAGDELRVLPGAVPLWLERALLVVAGVWFVNLVNFMDGLDWITVAEIVPVTATLALLGPLGVVEPLPALVAAALCGGMLGFAPFNKPVAKLFLGDVGSLPIGLVTAWLLFGLAAAGGLVAAILLPLYHLADATITLGRRIMRRERVWEAHRSHFYQRATDNGFSATMVSARVFGLNLVLAALAILTLAWPTPAVQIAALAVGAGLVGLLLAHFSKPEASS